MSDIVERLRAADISGHGKYSALVREAAAEIERLKAAVIDWGRREEEWSTKADIWKAEIERLAAALRAALPVLIDDMKDGNERSDEADERAISLIRAALEGKP